MQASIQSIDETSAMLSGDLTLHQVGQLLEQGAALIKRAPQCWQVDMLEVQQVSSAGAALLIEWLKICQQQGKQFSIKNFPKSLQPILSISDLQPIFTPLLRANE